MVGSLNPVKVKAVEQAIADWLPGCEVKGIEVASDVSPQPKSDEETRLGAQTRARKTWVAGQEKHAQKFLGAVGLEGGITQFAGKWWSTVWVAFTDDGQTFWEANGGRIPLAPELTNLMTQQKTEMGLAMEVLTGQKNLKHQEGMFGIVTQGVVDRAQGYSAIARMALGLWHGRAWVTCISDQSTV